MKTLLILRGLPGSGKSTLARTMIELAKGSNNTPAYCSADSFMVNNHGEYEFRYEILAECHALCQDLARASMKAGTELVIIDNTNTTEKELAPYAKMAKEFGYDTHFVIVENRAGTSSVHDVPEAAISAMKGRFSISL